MVIGQIISLDDWVPERPPKNPMLRIPSPDLPPPPPTNHVDDCNDMHIPDEPLPPPPPELLRHMRQLSEPETKVNTASRRNSFAGSTSKKPLIRSSTADSLISVQDKQQPMQQQQLPQQQLPPPIIPKKPLDMRNSHYSQPSIPQRPMSSLARHGPSTNSVHSLKPHKVVLNGKIESSQTVPQGRHSDTRMSLRKRSHNAQLTPLEMPSISSKQMHNTSQPPPLKPRIPIVPPSTDHNNRSSSAMGNRLR